MSNLTVRQFAKLHDLSTQRVQQWCATGRLTGAYQDDAKAWHIPSSAARPTPSKRGWKLGRKRKPDINVKNVK